MGRQLPYWRMSAAHGGGMECAERKLMIKPLRSRPRPQDITLGEMRIRHHVRVLECDIKVVAQAHAHNSRGPKPSC